MKAGPHPCRAKPPVSWRPVGGGSILPPPRHQKRGLGTGVLLIPPPRPPERGTSWPPCHPARQTEGPLASSDAWIFWLVVAAVLILFFAIDFFVGWVARP